MATSAVELIKADQAPLLARPYFGDSGPSPITASLAHVPELLEVALPFIGAVLGPSAIGARTKEIVIVRTSAALECRYCVQSHAAIALDAGLARDEVLALRGEAAIELAFSDEGERALIARVDGVALGRGEVPADERTRLAGYFADPAIVELTLLTGATMMLNRYCTALELPTSAATLTRLAEEGLA